MMFDSFAFLLLGALIGFLSGLFGVGGSSIATPLLRLFGVARLEALASPLPVALPTAIVGGLTYWRQGLVHGRIAFWTALGGAPMALLGSYLTTVVPGRILMLLTGVFVLAVGGRLLMGPLDSDSGETATRPPVRIGVLLLVGAVVGFLSGLLANGGGFLLVPAYMLICHLSPQEAAATSLVAVVFLAVPGTWAHWELGHVVPRLSMLLALGALPTTYLGARAGLALDKDQARWVFGAFLLVFGWLFFVRTVYRAELLGWLT
jgi:hypothetical protein